MQNRAGGSYIMKINLSEQPKDILLGKKPHTIKIIDMQKTQQSGFTEIAVIQSGLVYLYSCTFYIGYFCNNFSPFLFFFFPLEDSSFTLSASEMESNSTTLYFLRPCIFFYYIFSDLC